GLAIARALRRLYPQAWEFPKVDRLLVHPDTIKAIDGGLPLDAVVDTYRTELAAFITKREKYLLYGTGACPAPLTERESVPSSAKSESAITVAPYSRAVVETPPP